MESLLLDAATRVPYLARRLPRARRDAGGVAGAAGAALGAAVATRPNAVIPPFALVAAARGGPGCARGSAALFAPPPRSRCPSRCGTSPRACPRSPLEPGRKVNRVQRPDAPGAGWVITRRRRRSSGPDRARRPRSRARSAREQNPAPCPLQLQLHALSRATRFRTSRTTTLAGGLALAHCPPVGDAIAALALPGSSAGAAAGAVPLLMAAASRRRAALLRDRPLPHAARAAALCLFAGVTLEASGGRPPAAAPPRRARRRRGGVDPRHHSPVASASGPAAPEPRRPLPERAASAAARRSGSRSRSARLRARGRDLPRTERGEPAVAAEAARLYLAGAGDAHAAPARGRAGGGPTQGALRLPARLGRRPPSALLPGGRCGPPRCAPQHRAQGPSAQCRSSSRCTL
jgi:hypothetical protein